MGGAHPGDREEIVIDEPEANGQPSGTGRGRRYGAIALVLIASVLAFPAIIALWANRQVVDTDNWTETSTELLENRQIRDQVATFLVDELYANVDVEAELQQALPPRLQPLAGPAAGALRDLAERTTKQALARPRAQQLWADANRAAHAQLMVVLEGGGTTVSTEGGNVVLNLRSLLGQIEERVGVGGRIQNALPESAAQITLLQSDELDTAQTGLKVVKGLPIVLVGLSLLLFGAALLLAPDRRRRSLLIYGLGLIGAGLAALLVRSSGGGYLSGSLATTASVEPSIEAAWDIFTPLLKEAATATIFYGVVAVAGALLAGRSRPATAIRRVLAPYARSLPVTYGALALVVLLVLWWAPTPALRNPITALILIVLLALGTEALRRQMVREHPDAVRPDPVGRMRYGATRAAAWAKDATASGTEAVRSARSGRSSEPADDQIAALERLGRLRDAGVVDGEEFAAQKRRILEEPGSEAAPEAPPPQPAGTQ